MRKLGFLTAFLLSVSVVEAAPIYCDIVGGTGSCESDENFQIHGFWTPQVGAPSTIDNEFAVPQPTFSNGRWRTSFAFVNLCTGTAQFDAWQHGGWYGAPEDIVNNNPLGCGLPEPPCLFNCDPPRVCLENCTPPVCIENCEPPTTPVYEPNTAVMLTSGIIAFWYWFARPQRRQS